METGEPGRGGRPDLTPTAVCAELNAARARYLVIGGVACILHGHVRATTDLDVLIEATEDNASLVLEALGRVGYGFAGEWAPREIVAKPVTVIGDDPAVDIFTIAWTLRYSDALARSITADIDGVAVPVIGLDDLIATKRTGRLQDAADVEVLEEIRKLRRTV
jgi:predicted nucleotidyltransferase